MLFVNLSIFKILEHLFGIKGRNLRDFGGILVIFVFLFSNELIFEFILFRKQFNEIYLSLDLMKSLLAYDQYILEVLISLDHSFLKK